jgi:hypothetical protein
MIFAWHWIKTYESPWIVTRDVNDIKTNFIKPEFHFVSILKRNDLF